MKKTRVGIVGASGYTGVELVRLIETHPGLALTYVAAEKAAGKRLDAVWPGLIDLPVGALVIEAFEAHQPNDLAARVDALFLALPHGVAGRVAPALVDAGILVVDLGADFRLRDPAVYARAYGLVHPSPERLPSAVYGLVELFREPLRTARLIACPGCYPTAVTLAAWPLVRAGLASDFIVADGMSGVSGAGRTPSARNLFCEVAEAASPYGVGGSHRHVPEIEQTLGTTVAFTPHLVPMSRGMIATVNMRVDASISAEQVASLYSAAYAREPLVTLRSEPPSTLDVRGTSRAHVHVVLDPARRVVTAFCAIDNLVKGASGQAMQALNVALGLPETAGLPLVPLTP